MNQVWQNDAGNRCLADTNTASNDGFGVSSRLDTTDLWSHDFTKLVPNALANAIFDIKIFGSKELFQRSGSFAEVGIGFEPSQFFS